MQDEPIESLHAHKLKLEPIEPTKYRVLGKTHLMVSSWALRRLRRRGTRSRLSKRVARILGVGDRGLEK